MLSLAVALHASLSVPYFLLVDADLNPRPALRACHQRAVYAGGYLNWAVASAWHEARPVADYVLTAGRVAARDAALTVAALLILTIPNGDQS